MVRLDSEPLKRKLSSYGPIGNSGRMMEVVYQLKRPAARTVRVAGKQLTTNLTPSQKLVIGRLPLKPVEFKP